MSSSQNNSNETNTETLSLSSNDRSEFLVVEANEFVRPSDAWDYEVTIRPRLSPTQFEELYVGRVTRPTLNEEAVSQLREYRFPSAADLERLRSEFRRAWTPRPMNYRPVQTFNVGGWDRPLGVYGGLDRIISPGKVKKETKEENMSDVPLLFRLKTRGSYCELEKVFARIETGYWRSSLTENAALAPIVRNVFAEHVLVFHPTEPVDMESPDLFQGYEFGMDENNRLCIKELEAPSCRADIKQTFLIHEKQMMTSPLAKEYYTHIRLNQKLNDAFLFGQRYSVCVRYGSSWDAVRRAKWGNGLDGTPSAS